METNAELRKTLIESIQINNIQKVKEILKKIKTRKNADSIFSEQKEKSIIYRTSSGIQYFSTYSYFESDISFFESPLAYAVANSKNPEIIFEILIANSTVEYSGKLLQIIADEYKAKIKENIDKNLEKMPSDLERYKFLAMHCHHEEPDNEKLKSNLERVLICHNKSDKKSYTTTTMDQIIKAKNSYQSNIERKFNLPVFYLNAWSIYLTESIELQQESYQTDSVFKWANLPEKIKQNSRFKELVREFLIEEIKTITLNKNIEEKMIFYLNGIASSNEEIADLFKKWFNDQKIELSKVTQLIKSNFHKAVQKRDINLIQMEIKRFNAHCEKILEKGIKLDEVHLFKEEIVSALKENDTDSIVFLILACWQSCKNYKNLPEKLYSIEELSTDYELLLRASVQKIIPHTVNLKELSAFSGDMSNNLIFGVFNKIEDEKKGEALQIKEETKSALLQCDLKKLEKLLLYYSENQQAIKIIETEFFCLLSNAIDLKDAETVLYILFIAVRFNIKIPETYLLACEAIEKELYEKIELAYDVHHPLHLCLIYPWKNPQGKLSNEIVEIDVRNSVRKMSEVYKKNHYNSTKIFELFKNFSKALFTQTALQTKNREIDSKNYFENKDTKNSTSSLLKINRDNMQELLSDCFKTETSDGKQEEAVEVPIIVEKNKILHEAIYEKAWIKDLHEAAQKKSWEKFDETIGKVEALGIKKDDIYSCFFVEYQGKTLIHRMLEDNQKGMQWFVKFLLATDHIPYPKKISEELYNKDRSAIYKEQAQNILKTYLYMVYEEALKEAVKGYNLLQENYSEDTRLKKIFKKNEIWYQLECLSIKSWRISRDLFPYLIGRFLIENNLIDKSLYMRQKLNLLQNKNQKELDADIAKYLQEAVDNDFKNEEKLSDLLMVLLKNKKIEQKSNKSMNEESSLLIKIMDLDTNKEHAGLIFLLLMEADMDNLSYSPKIISRIASNYKEKLEEKFLEYVDVLSDNTARLNFLKLHYHPETEEKNWSNYERILLKNQNYLGFKTHKESERMIKISNEIAVYEGIYSRRESLNKEIIQFLGGKNNYLCERLDEIEKLDKETQSKIFVSDIACLDGLHDKPINIINRYKSVNCETEVNCLVLILLASNHLDYPEDFIQQVGKSSKIEILEKLFEVAEQKKKEGNIEEAIAFLKNNCHPENKKARTVIEKILLVKREIINSPDYTNADCSIGKVNNRIKLYETEGRVQQTVMDKLDKKVVETWRDKLSAVMCEKDSTYEKFNEIYAELESDANNEDLRKAVLFSELSSIDGRQTLEVAVKNAVYHNEYKCLARILSVRAEDYQGTIKAYLEPYIKNGKINKEKLCEALIKIADETELSSTERGERLTIFKRNWNPNAPSKRTPLEEVLLIQTSIIQWNYKLGELKMLGDAYQKRNDAQSVKVIIQQNSKNTSSTGDSIVGNDTVFNTYTI